MHSSYTAVAVLHLPLTALRTLPLPPTGAARAVHRAAGSVCDGPIQRDSRLLPVHLTTAFMGGRARCTSQLQCQPALGSPGARSPSAPAFALRPGCCCPAVDMAPCKMLLLALLACLAALGATSQRQQLQTKEADGQGALCCTVSCSWGSPSLGREGFTAAVAAAVAAIPPLWLRADRSIQLPVFHFSRLRRSPQLQVGLLAVASRARVADAECAGDGMLWRPSLRLGRRTQPLPLHDLSCSRGHAQLLVPSGRPGLWARAGPGHRSFGRPGL